MASLNRKFTSQSATSTSSLLSSTASDPLIAGLSRTGSVVSMKSSIAERYSLAASPRTWGTPLDMRTPEPDDDLHNPSSTRDRMNDRGSNIFTTRGFANLGCLTLLIVGLLTLFAGYPLISHFTTVTLSNQGGFNLGGINSTGQIPDMVGNYGLIDRDTPQSAYKVKSYETGDDMVLVFSDEFNVDGRTFYPGDDPYWEAVDLWYWGTLDLEWYDPSQVTTKNGELQITLVKVDDPSTNHNMSYKSAMIQSWNKFCFTGGMIQASVRLPGANNVGGLWPALWTMGNLGRAGYGASLEGMWPYSYDSCDIGTLPNQTFPDFSGPPAAISGGDRTHGGELSWLPGQRLSACTCAGESHPGPVRSDGTYVGRAAPEIDVFEAIIDPTETVGQVSQSSQWAPYNAGYRWFNTTSNYNIQNSSVTVLNPYQGGVFQQSVSGLSNTNQSCYELESGCFTMYGFEYAPGFDNAYITWLNNGVVSWGHKAAGMAADNAAEIGPRPVSQEPMYIIVNLGISEGFGKIDPNLVFPATMSIDWIRVYQPANKVQITCDPEDFPTAKYIQTYSPAYLNPNLTTWVDDFKQPWPKNSKSAQGCT